jgi:kynurenine 3-monooxygenase
MQALRVPARATPMSTGHGGRRGASVATGSSSTASWSSSWSPRRPVAPSPMLLGQQRQRPPSRLIHPRSSSSSSSSTSSSSIPASSATTTPNTTTTETTTKPNEGALIVGGGPAGVAAALMLVKLRGWTNVTIVERSHDLSWADPDRSYVYGVDGRGVRCAEMLGLDQDLLAAGVDITSVPLTRVGRDGKANTRMVGTKDPSVATHWMPRASLMKVLVGGLDRFNGSTEEKEKKHKAVEVLTSSRVVGLERDKATGRVAVRVEVGAAEGEEGKTATTTRTFYPSLVLGCDGINSVVRKALERWAEEDDDNNDTTTSPTFSLRSFPSPAAGLKFKVLRLPPNPRLNPDDPATTLRNPSFAVLVGQYKGRPLRMGLLPVRDESMGRTGNIITPPDHPFWHAPPQGDAAACRAALKEAFPQADWDSLVPEDVMRAFAESEGGVFPLPQASDGVAYVLKGGDGGGGGGGESGAAAAEAAAATTAATTTTTTTTAVLLVGDAAHAFPPDLGQGVNAALQDVQALERHLADSPTSLAAAAHSYGQDRAPEALALAKLVSFGYPYQYQQSPLKAKVWMLGFLARLVLSKLTLGKLVAPPAFMLVQNTRLRYAEVLERSLATTRRLVAGLVAALVAAAAWWVFGKGGGAALRAAVGGAA